MKKREFLIALLVPLLFGACATNPPAALDLKKPATQDVIELSERISFVKHQGLLKIRWEYGLMPGKYVAESANAQGTFYRGQGRPVWARGGSETATAQINLGGIWIPNNDSDTPRLYVIREAEAHTAQNLDQYALSYSQNAIATGVPIGSAAIGSAVGTAIVGAIVAAEEGTIYIFDPSSDTEFDRRLRSAFAARKPMSGVIAPTTP